jgi:hypothetical protein
MKFLVFPDSVALEILFEPRRVRRTALRSQRKKHLNQPPRGTKGAKELGGDCFARRGIH